ncbi:hypothetical protein ACQPZZ_19095 [Microbispora sp. CA-135349]|uniref:hypothetical protein n=1 Tax=Microbispora sp. CA-135349 TaxID=3239953 RepID=UPI003D944B71
MRRPSSETAAPPLGRLHEVGERRLMLHRSGSGGPSVVFLPGAGLVGLDFLNVHEGGVIDGASHQYLHVERAEEVLRAIRDLAAAG